VVQSGTVAVTGGSVTLTLPQVADGEAWTVTVAPAGTTTVAPTNTSRK
jgi:hypothetical protein